LYDKSRHVYGLHLAKEAIRKQKYVILAEGNLDVIASHQAGERECVATAGTALTEYQLKALGRFTEDIRLSFDQDRAGLAAAERAIPIASKVGVSLSIITVPNGKDPDELIKQDPKAWQQAIANPTYAVDWLIKRYKQQVDVTSAPGKREFSNVLLPIVKQLRDSVEQDHYIQEIAGVIGVSADALRAKMTQTGRGNPERKVKPHKAQPVDPVTAEQIKLQDHLLALVLLQPALRTYLERLTAEMMFTDEGRKLLEFLLAHPDYDGQKHSATGALRPLADYVKILSVEYEELYQDDEMLELQREATRLYARLVEVYVKNEKQKLAQQLATADEQSTQLLLGKAKDLDALLKTIKGGV
jgi:DNA primase